MDFEKRICEYCHAHVRLLTGRKKCICSYCGRVSYPAPPNFFNMRESDAVDYCNSIIKEDSERGFRLLESYAKAKNTIDAWYHIYYIARKQNVKYAVRSLENILLISRDTSNKYVRTAFLRLYEAYYFEKFGCTKNAGKAFTYLLPLAQSKYATDIQLYNIGIMYYNGDGTVANRELAIYYLKLASAKGYTEATQIVESYEYETYLSSIRETYTPVYTPSDISYIPDTTEYTGYTGDFKKKNEELDDLSGSFYGTNT